MEKHYSRAEQRAGPCRPHKVESRTTFGQQTLKPREPMRGNKWPQESGVKKSPSPHDRDGEQDHRSLGTFSGILRRHFRNSGLSITALAHLSWLDIGYVSRLLNQDSDPLNPPITPDQKSKHPSRDAVIRLGLGLRLALEDLDELLMAAGYAPLVR